MKQTFKEFLIEYYDVTKPDIDDDSDSKSKKEKKKSKKDKCEKIEKHNELVDFLTKSTATQN